MGAMMLIDEGEGAQSTYGTMEREKEKRGGVSIFKLLIAEVGGTCVRITLKFTYYRMHFFGEIFLIPNKLTSPQDLHKNIHR